MGHIIAQMIRVQAYKINLRRPGKEHAGAVRYLPKLCSMTIRDGPPPAAGNGSRSTT